MEYSVGSGSAIRGSRVGAGPMGEAERGEAAPRVRVPFYCANKHEVVPSFANEAAVPEEWDCPRCGFPAGKDPQNPPAPPRTEPYKTHLAYVKERRSEEEGKLILDEALAKLRAERAEVEAHMKANANSN
ncbi:RNA polymerase-binding protein RbpA [Streptomonospora algeriensis]|uniref:RNA polymerase-binding protein RbpA n=1 Tax=Streptomonospora algeriensis TaxID=995084 RepID=A0ABW3BHH5_9ACTN